MKKLIFIGIDGLDNKYVKDHLEELPNFKTIIQNSPSIKSKSVFPPDSDTAWSTIYTGLNPAKHGVVDFVDPLERQKIIKKESEYSYVNFLEGKTFWDILSKNNLKSCVIYPHMCFPPWDINGLMISPDPKKETFQFTPIDYKFNFNIQDLKVLKRIPRTKFEFKSYLQKKREITINEFKFATSMYQNEKWDFFFFYTSALDSMMHLFWNYCDKDDPTYPGENQFQNSIIDFHKLQDRLLGEFLQNIDGHQTVMICSDHGHSRRPTDLININEVLRKIGYLHIKEGIFLPFISSKEKIKRIIVDIAQKSGLRPIAQTILRVFPKIKKMYTEPALIDFGKSVAHCTDLSGMKAYSYGGIKVYREKFDKISEYENCKNKIIKELREIKIPNTNENIFKWVKVREDVYNGRFIEKYPEILFDLNENFGSGWSVNNGFWAKSVAHKFFPGSHRGDTPVFYLINYNHKLKFNDITLEDIFPSIMSYFKISIDEMVIDGRPFI